MGLIGGVMRNATTHTTLVWANACLTGTLNCASTDGNGVWNATWGYEGVSVTHSAGTGFYDLTLNYTEADIQWYPAYGLYGYWKVVELTPKPYEPPPCCFVAHTLIQMADGFTKPIAEVMVGEYVVGSKGMLNQVLGVEQPLLGGRQLYAINQGGPFVTGEHPFLSNSGWRAINPAALKLENATFLAKALNVGERLLVARRIRFPAMIGSLPERAEFEVEELQVTSLKGFDADPDNRVYNLLLDGNHTYIANGFMVHNKGSH